MIVIRIILTRLTANSSRFQGQDPTSIDSKGILGAYSFDCQTTSDFRWTSSKYVQNRPIVPPKIPLKFSHCLFRFPIADWQFIKDAMKSN